METDSIRVDIIISEKESRVDYGRVHGRRIPVDNAVDFSENVDPLVDPSKSARGCCVGCRKAARPRQT